MRRTIKCAALLLALVLLCAGCGKKQPAQPDQYGLAPEPSRLDGVAIGNDGKPQMLTDRGGSFLSGVPLLKAGAKLRRNLTPDVARSAARTAVGWMPNGKVCLWCDKTSLTRDQLQDKLLGLGVVDALMLDGGGSTQGIFPGGKVTSSRKVPTLLLFWERSAIKAEDQALVWGKAHGLLTDANAGETVTREQLVRALYKLEGGHG